MRTKTPIRSVRDYRDRQNKRAAKLRAKRLKNKLCRSCATPLPLDENGESRSKTCDGCLEQIAKYKRDRRRKLREERHGERAEAA